MRQALLYSVNAAAWPLAASAGQTGSEPLRLLAFMTAKAKTELDAFDRAYRDRILEAVRQAIIDASRDPATKTAQLRNYEIYDALLQTQAMRQLYSGRSGTDRFIVCFTPRGTKRASRSFAIAKSRR